MRAGVSSVVTARAGAMRLLAGAMFLLVLLPAACRQPYQMSGTVLAEPIAAPDAVLEAVNGPVTLQDFAGQYTYLYFGYTHCPDACPTAMATLKRVKEELGDQAGEMEVVMVTVDPQRDTPEALAGFLANFDSSFVGLSGDLEAISSAAAPFGITFAQHEGTTASGYLVDHTARILLLDRQNRVIVIYPHDTPADTLAGDLQHLLDSEG